MSEILTSANADTVSELHPAGEHGGCGQTVTVGPRGGVTYPRTERYRRNGRTQRWVRQPERYSIPMKYGLKDAFRVENDTYGRYGRMDFHTGTAEDCTLGTLRASIENAQAQS